MPPTDSSSTKVQFPGSLGASLAARLDLPVAAPRAFAVFAHCFTCSKESKAAAYIARALTGAGFGVLRFDFTGLGGSGGDFGNTDFSSNIADLVAACDWLRAEHQAPAVIIGHSLGGAAALAAVEHVPECRAVATIGAPFDPEHVREQFRADLDLIEREGEAQVRIAGRPFRITRGFIDDLAGQPQRERLRRLRKPLLVMHSPIDDVVGIDNARRIFDAAMHPKSFVSLDDADHLLVRESDSAYAAGVLVAWAARYLQGAQATTSTKVQGAQATTSTKGAPATPSVQVVPSSSPVPAGIVRVVESGRGRFANEVHTAHHALLADEPAALGGTDHGMSPYELLQAALGACTAMTIRMVADRRKLALERVEVDLHHEKMHATDCEDCESREGRIDRIEREIRLIGTLSQAERDGLLAIADKCPVHRTLHSEVSVVTRLAAPAADKS